MRWLALLLLLVAPATAFADSHVVSLGRCELAQGGVIEDCRIGYTDYGRPTADFSNVIVVPTWLSGQSPQLESFFKFAQEVASSASYVIIIDALGNGVSSSPSNSPGQAGHDFPLITIDDMVKTQHTLLTKNLGISHVKAIMGLSMGAFQALQWAVTYPDFMDKVVNVAGTPRPAAADLALWRAELRALEATTLTPDGFNANLRSQVLAMLQHDVAPGLSYQDMAQVIQAQMFTVAAKYDKLVDPRPSLELARALHSKELILDSLCGHFAPALCSVKQTRAAIEDFLFDW